MNATRLLIVCWFLMNLKSKYLNRTFTFTIFDKLSDDRHTIVTVHKYVENFKFQSINFHFFTTRLLYEAEMYFGFSNYAQSNVYNEENRDKF